MLTLSAISYTWCSHFPGKWAQKKLQSRSWTFRIWNPHGHASSHFEAVARQMTIQGGGWWKKQKPKWPVSLSEWCKVCPRGGATGQRKDTFSDFLAGFQPKITTVPYLNFYDNISKVPGDVRIWKFWLNTNLLSSDFFSGIYSYLE